MVNTGPPTEPSGSDFEKSMEFSPDACTPHTATVLGDASRRRLPSKTPVGLMDRIRNVWTQEENPTAVHPFYSLMELSVSSSPASEDADRVLKRPSRRAAVGLPTQTAQRFAWTQSSESTSDGCGRPDALKGLLSSPSAASQDVDSLHKLPCRRAAAVLPIKTAPNFAKAKSSKAVANDSELASALMGLSLSPGPNVNSTKPKKHTLLSLPLEIREKVYTFAFEEFSATLTVKEGDTFCPSPLPPVCYTSKQIWLEAGLAYLRRTNFEFGPGTYGRRNNARLAFLVWLSTFPENQGYNSIRSISYTTGDGYFGPLPSLSQKKMASDDDEYPRGMITRCPGLQRLTLSLGLDDLVTDSLEKTGDGFKLQNRLRTAQELRDRELCLSHFRVLFELRNLKMLHLKLDRRLRWTSMSLDEESPKLSRRQEAEFKFAPFVSFIKSGFENRGEDFELIIEYED